MSRFLCVLFCLFVWACGGSSDANITPDAGTSTTSPSDIEQDSNETPDEGTGSGTEEIDEPDAQEDVSNSDVGTTDDADTKVEPPCDCNDQNECTNDLCQPDGSCEYEYKLTPECAPWVKITAPQRATSLVYNQQPVAVSGEAGSKNGPLASLSLNSTAIFQADNNTFATSHMPTHGVNTLKAVATDVNTLTQRHLQSYMMAESYYPTTEGPSESALVDKGLVVWLGKEVWDDNDLSDLDDMATLAHMVLEGMDIVSLIPSPIAKEGEGPGLLWCKWEVTIKEVTFKVDYVDFVPVAGGLRLNAKLSKLAVDFDAIAPAFGCPDAIGTATSDSVSIEADIAVSMSAAGALLVDLETVKVTVKKPKVDIKEGAASWVDWAINWFSNSLAGYIESAVEDTINNELVPLVKQMLTDLSNFEQSFEIPPLPFIEKGITITVKAAPSHVNFTQEGMTMALKMSATAPKAFSWLSSPGSIARGGCLVGNHKNLSLPSAPIAMAIHDDLLNQVLFGAWWGGLANIKIDPEYVTGKLPELPVQDVSVQVDPWLPPILTSCKDDGSTIMQVGDLRVLITFNVIGGKSAAIEVFGNGSFDVSLGASPGENGSLNLELSINKVLDVDFHLVDVSGAIDGSEDFIATVLQDVVSDLVIDAFADGFMKSFPIPKLDIGGIIPGVKEGTYLGLKPDMLARQGAYIIVSGKVSD